MTHDFRVLSKQVEALGLELVRNDKADATTPRDDEGRFFAYSICAPMGGASMRQVSMHTLSDVALHLEHEEIKHES